MPKSPLLDQVREVLRLRHYSIRTEEAYVQTIRRFILYHLMASLLYGSGLRLMECVRLRVKDLDFQYKQITVRDGKGERDRRTILPQPLIEPL